MMRRLPTLAWLAACVGVLGALAIIGLALWQRGEEAPISRGERPVTAIAAVHPTASFIGDRIEATLVLTVNRELADPERLNVQARFRPFTRVEPVAIDQRDTADAAVLRYTYVLQCIDRSCVAELPDEEQFVPGRAFVRYVGSAFGMSVLPVAWPAITVTSRLSSEADESAFRVAESPPQPSTSIDPTVLGWLLAGAAAALVLAVASAAFVLLRRGAPEPVSIEPQREELPPLESALETLDRVRDGNEAERRVALDELARALEQDGNPALAPRATQRARERRAPAANQIDAHAPEVATTRAWAP
jgi:hypothetical protein